MRPFSRDSPRSHKGSLAFISWEKKIMKESTDKFEASSWGPNLMLAAAVVAAATPMLLGDQLILIASSVVTEGSVLFESLSISLQNLLS